MPNDYIKVESHMSLKGKVKIPFAPETEDYSKIVVVDELNRLNIASKPNGQDFDVMFSDTISNSQTAFGQLFPNNYHTQGFYHVQANIYFQLNRRGLLYYVFRSVLFTIIVAPSAQLNTQVIGQRIVNHSGTYMEIADGVIIYQGLLPQSVINTNVELSPSGNVHLIMNHTHPKITDWPFNAFVKILKTS